MRRPERLHLVHQGASKYRGEIARGKTDRSCGNFHRMDDIIGFEQHVQDLRAGETLFVAWQHWFLTFMANALGLDGLVPSTYPTSCNYSQWTEPEYASDSTEGNCYDVLWQLVLFRERSDESWRAEAFEQMHMGFGGHEDSPCASAFYPNSSPSSWHIARAQAEDGLVIEPAP